MLMSSTVTMLNVTLETAPYNLPVTQSDLLIETVNECRRTLEEMLQKLKKIIACTSKTSPLIWPFTKTEVDDIVSRLLRYKITLNNILQINQLYHNSSVDF